MDIQALEAALTDTVKVTLVGQTFTLNAPSLKRAGDLQMALGRAVTDAGEGEDDKAQAFMDSSVDAVMECLTDDIPRPLVEKVIVRTGTMASPLVRAARKLCGFDWTGSEEDPDQDLPT